jgi:hypothetical protein
MYTVHYLHPERQWGVFCNDVFVKAFTSHEDAEKYCNKHNEAR